MLNKRQTANLSLVCTNLQRAVDYLNQPEIAGIARALKNPANANGSNYRIINPACLNPDRGGMVGPEVVVISNKCIGSDIACLYTALDQLRSFLANEQKVSATHEDETTACLSA